MSSSEIPIKTILFLVTTFQLLEAMLYFFERASALSYQSSLKLWNFLASILSLHCKHWQSGSNFLEKAPIYWHYCSHLLPLTQSQKLEPLCQYLVVFQIFVSIFQISRKVSQFLAGYASSNSNPKVVIYIPKIGNELPADSGCDGSFSQCLLSRQYFCYSVCYSAQWL